MLGLQPNVILLNLLTSLVLEGVSPLRWADEAEVGSYDVWSQDYGQVAGVH